MKGDKTGEGLRGGNRMARWRINLKINKRVVEFGRRGRRGRRGSQRERHFQSPGREKDQGMGMEIKMREGGKGGSRMGCGGAGVPEDPQGPWWVLLPWP